MLYLMILCSICLFGFAVLYLFWGRSTSRLYRRGLRSENEAPFLPRATVLLPLRGKDPFLIDCISGLLNQEYPDYDVKIIVDHEDDPAYTLVNQYLSDNPHPHCQVGIRERYTGTCGLKNEALIQALGELDETTEVFAWLDSDVVPHPTWLRELVSPLQNSQIGVASGIRWYVPRDHNPASLIRAVWNAGAVMQMLALEIAWGGSIALSRQVFQNPHLVESWSKMMWDDTGLKAIVSKMGLHIGFAPAATMINQESISMRPCFRFIARQLMNVRFYHPHWRWIAGVGIVATVSKLTLIGLMLMFLIQGNWLYSGIIAVVLVLASSCIGAVLYRTDAQIRRMMSAREDDLKPLPFRTIGTLWITIYVYCAALFAAMSRIQTIQWRGVVYEITPPHQIQITHYEPYQEADASSTSNEIENISL